MTQAHLAINKGYLMEENNNVSPEATEAPIEATVTEESGEQISETSYVDGKFKSVSALEDSYKELQSTFSKKLGAFEGSPEDGYSYGEGEIAGNDKAMLDMLGEWGTEQQLSQQGFEGLATKYNDFNAAQRAAGIDAAYKELGENADRRLENARNFLVANLGEEQTTALATQMNTSASIEAIEKLIALTKSPQTAPVQATEAVSAEKLNAMRYAVDEHGNRKMDNPSYRKQVIEAEARAKGVSASFLVKD